MSSKDKRVLIWVHPNFRREVKLAAFKNDMEVTQYTKKIAEYMNPIERLVKDCNDKFKKKKEYDFM